MRRSAALPLVALVVAVGAAAALLSAPVNGQSELRARVDAVAGTPAIKAFGSTI